MILHIQTDVDKWHQIDLGNLNLRRKKEKCVLSRIKEALVKEKNFPSTQRKCEGFHITLSLAEEYQITKLIRQLHEPLTGKIEGDAKLVEILRKITASYDNGIRVIPYTGSYKEAGTAPLFEFWAETWLR